MDCTQTQTIQARKPGQELCESDLIASLHQEFGPFIALEEDPEESWKSECSPEELEARLAFYAD